MNRGHVDTAGSSHFELRPSFGPRLVTGMPSSELAWARERYPWHLAVWENDVVTLEKLIKDPVVSYVIAMDDLLVLIPVW